MEKVNRYPARKPFEAEEQVQQALRTTESGLLDIQEAMSRRTLEFFIKAQEERKYLRQQILSRASLEAGQHINFSHFVLTKRVTDSGIALRWERIWRAKKSNTKLPQRVMYKYVPKAGGNYHPKSICAGAHPEEIPLILVHEAERRAIADSWSRIYACTRMLKGLINQVTRVDAGAEPSIE